MLENLAYRQAKVAVALMRVKKVLYFFICQEKHITEDFLLKIVEMSFRLQYSKTCDHNVTL